MKHGFKLSSFALEIIKHKLNRPYPRQQDITSLNNYEGHWVSKFTFFYQFHSSPPPHSIWCWACRSLSNVLILLIHYKHSAISGILEIFNSGISYLNTFSFPCSLFRWPHAQSWNQLSPMQIFPEFYSHCQPNISTFPGFLNLTYLFTRAVQIFLQWSWSVAPPAVPATFLGSLCPHEE